MQEQYQILYLLFTIFFGSTIVANITAIMATKYYRNKKKQVQS